MKSRFKTISAAVLSVVAVSQGVCAATIINPVEDVMTSGFFQGSNTVRGYAGDSRNVHRVSTDGAFGVTGPETIYVTFDSASFSSLLAPVPQALLYVESASGGFGADAGASNPFTVSAHAVSPDPLVNITDDTNAGGTIEWLTYYNNNILPADAAGITVVDGFGTVTFDVTSVVNDWIAGSNTVFAIALTGKNDTSGNAFLHGFLNNTENAGSTYLSLVPGPASFGLGACGLMLIARRQLH